MGLDNPLHIAILLVIVLLVFGAKRLPEMGRSLGTGMREFKDSISGASNQSTITQATQQQAPVAPPVQAPPVQAPPVQQAPVQPVAPAPAPPQAPVAAPVGGSQPAEQQTPQG